jgi:signal transduction histidine kinase/streptogramin lyase
MKSDSVENCKLQIANSLWEKLNSTGRHPAILNLQRYRSAILNFEFSILNFKIGALILLLLLQFTEATSQQSLPAFHARFFPVSSNEGLSQGFVPSIIQDKRGFIWFATKDGLNKYDGYTFTIYRHEPENPLSISDNYIHEIFEDSRGLLWVNTLVGLDIFDPQTEEFTHVVYEPEKGNQNFFSIQEDQFGNLWGETRFVYHYIAVTENGDKGDPRQNGKYSFAHTTADKALAKMGFTGSTNFIFVDPNYDLWIKKTDTLVYISKADQRAGKITARYFQPAFLGFPGASVSWIVADTIRHTLIFSSHEGFSIYNLDAHAVEKTVPFKMAYDPESMNVEANGNVWFYADGRCFVLNYENFRIELVTPMNMPESDWFSFGIKSILVDYSGLVWLGTNGYGVFKYNPLVSSFRLLDNKIVSDVNGDNRGRAYVTFGDHIFYFDPAQPKIGERAFAEKKFALDVNNETVFPRNFKQDKSGIFWLNYGAGYLARYDETNGSVQFFKAQLPENAGKPLYVSRTWLDEKNEPWITIQCRDTGYICHFNPAAKKFDIPVKLPEMRLNGAYHFISAALTTLDGEQWLGTTQGVFRYSTKTGKWKIYKNIPGDKTSLSNDIVFSLGTDPLEPGKYLWVGTNSGGLNRLDMATGKFRRFTDKEGLPNNVIYGILSDDANNLWLSTNHGLCRFNTQSYACKNYFATDGLQSNEFNRYVYYKSEDGTLYFGGVSGMSYFQPKDLRSKDTPPKIAFTGFRLYNQDVSFRDSAAVIPMPIDFVDGMTLNFDQNVIAIQFAALDFSAPDKNQYKYKLEGFDKDWVYSGSRREAIYTGLEPGEYTLTVMASNSEGIWTTTGKSLAIRILPPWWKTWWATTLFIVMAIGLIGAFIFIRTANLRRNQKVLEERVRERTRKLDESLQDLKETQKQLIKNEKLASFGQLTAGIAHEIKNPLNFITNFSELSGEMIDELRTAKDQEERDEILESLKNNLVKINFHGGRVDSIIKSMLNHSRTAGAIRQATDINKLCEEFANLAYHSMRANVQDFSCNLRKSLDKNLPVLNVVPQDISRVLLNLLNNAFYAVNEKRKDISVDFKPEVAIVTVREGNMAMIVVRDNGKGIPGDVMEKLFDPFFTTKPAGEGTGLGLSISYDIIQSHGGNIRVDSKPDEFTEFVIRIPISNSTESKKSLES